MKRAIRNCIALLILTSVIAFSPYYIPETHAVSIRITTQSTDDHIQVSEGEVQQSTNTEAVDGSVFWIIIGFGLIVSALFIFISYQRRMVHSNEDEATNVYDNDLDGQG